MSCLRDVHGAATTQTLARVSFGEDDRIQLKGQLDVYALRVLALPTSSMTTKVVFIYQQHLSPSVDFWF